MMPEFDFEAAYLRYYRDEMTAGQQPISKLEFLTVCKALCEVLLEVK